MIYVVYGEEYFLLKKECESIIKKENTDNIISVDLEEVSLEDIAEEIMYIDIFNNKKLIIINNFSFKKLNDSDNKLFDKIMDNINNNTLLIKCIDSSLDDRKSIIKKLKTKFNVIGFKKLDRYKLNDEIFSLFKQEGFKISNDLVKKIINKCGYNNYSEDNGYIFNEVNKLIIYKGEDKSITESDINKIISKNMENEIFTFSSAVISRDKNEIFKELKIIKSLDIDPYLIFNTISKQFRTLLQIKSLCKKMDNNSISKKLGINPYVVEIQSKNLSLYSDTQLSMILHKLFEIDLVMKSETVNGYKIIEKFLLTL